MRQRKLRDFDGRRARVSSLIVEEGQACRGRWRDLFGEDLPLFLELGCGKGGFLAALAAREAGSFFIGAEGNESVLIQAAEKAQAAGLTNVCYLPGYINEPLEIFGEDELSGIYLNFSDPWPKARHEKRRLTSPHYLKSYEQAVEKGGFLAFKTDNEPLFRYSVEQIRLLGYEEEAYTEDLHHSPFAADNLMTEYEAKFSGRGQNIFYIKCIIGR